MRQGRRAQGSRGRLASSVLVAALVLVGAVGATSASAQDTGTKLTAADVGLEATAGFGGQVIRGRYTPVEVRIAPDRLVAGQLRVLTDLNGRQQAETRDVEVSAGSAKVYRFVTPPAAALTVELVTEQGTVRATADADRSGRYLVGVLAPALPDRIPPVTAPAFDAQATVVAVDPVWLERGGQALDSLSALVADTATLASLDDAARAILTTWVAAGADLIVVAAPGAVDLPVPWNPASAAEATSVELAAGTTTEAREIVPTDGAWALTVADVADSDDTTPIAATTNAGRGRVTVVGVGLGEGDLGADGALWGLLAPPRGAVTRFDDGGTLSRMVDLAPQTLQTGAIDLPPVGGLALFLLAYVVVVGPLNGFVLRRIGRRELSWGTIPAITVVFATAAWVGAGSSSPSVGLSGEAAWWVDGSGVETTVVGLRSPRPGAHEILLEGDQWTPVYGSWGRPAAIDRDGGDTTLTLDLEALELGTVIASRPTDTPAPLTVTITDRGAGLTASVRNDSTVAIEDVQLRAGSITTEVGTIQPGETADVGMANVAALRQRNAWEEDFVRDVNGVPRAPQSLEALLRWQILDAAPGVLWATGVVPDGLPGLGVPRADGTAASGIGTFLAVGITPVVRGDIQPTDVQRDLVVAGFGDAWRPTPWTIEGQLEAVLRYRLPRSGEVETLISTLDRGGMNFDGGGFEACFMVEMRELDGTLISQMETCGDPNFPEPPPCPPDVNACSFDGEVMTLCVDEDCREATVEPVDVPEQIRGRGLEVWDVQEREWVIVAEAFPDGRGDARRFLNPLGEVIVRAQGELRPFEFSGRGIGAELVKEASR